MAINNSNLTLFFPPNYLILFPGRLTPVRRLAGLHPRLASSERRKKDCDVKSSNLPPPRGSAACFYTFHDHLFNATVCFYFMVFSSSSLLATLSLFFRLLALCAVFRVATFIFPPRPTQRV